MTTREGKRWDLQFSGLDEAIMKEIVDRVKWVRGWTGRTMVLYDAKEAASDIAAMTSPGSGAGLPHTHDGRFGGVEG